MAREQMFQWLIQSHNEVGELMAEVKTKESKIRDCLLHFSLEQGVLLTNQEIVPEVILVPRIAYGFHLAILRSQKMPEFGFLMFRNRLKFQILEGERGWPLRRIYFSPSQEIREIMRQYDQGYVVADPEIHAMSLSNISHDPTPGEYLGMQMMQVVESIMKTALQASGRAIEFLFVRHASKMNEIMRDITGRRPPNLASGSTVLFCEVDEFRSRMLRQYGSDIVQEALSFIDFERSNIEERKLKDELIATPFLEISGCIM